MSNKKLRGREDWLAYEMGEEIRMEMDSWSDASGEFDESADENAGEAEEDTDSE